jgi:hypothetical protein
MRGKSTLTCLVAVLLAGPAWPALAAGGSSLATAAKSQDRDAVRALLQRGEDVNAPLPDGTTALHWSAQWADIESARLLVKAGANVNAVNDHQITPLALSCLNGDGPMIAFLLNAGANPNMLLPGKETALMAAARTGSLEGLRALLAHGANVNAVEPTAGQTALMWAVAEGIRTRPRSSSKPEPPRTPARRRDSRRCCLRAASAIWRPSSCSWRQASRRTTRSRLEAPRCTRR